ncbi:MAG TPA: hypothetical protein VN798_21085 [Pseudomonas sp.]|nr:hypothetical protein [Pseudomonas sp.]
MRLESLAIRLLATLADGVPCRVNPLDFTALLYLRDKGYAVVSIQDGCVVAERTWQGKQFASERRLGSPRVQLPPLSACAFTTPADPGNL